MDDQQSGAILGQTEQYLETHPGQKMLPAAIPTPSSSIPSSAAPFFQEYDFTRLDVTEHAGLIIERILAYGNRAELHWLVQTYGWETIRGWIAGSGLYRLPLLRYNLWCLVFEVPREERQRGVWDK
jgi:hypothetical protein